jgi:tRNA nucleotidyltransferase/poly(A) polymerase
MKNFSEYLMFREGEEKEEKHVASELKLSDDSPYKPFIVDRQNHPDLRILIKAFEDSPNIPVGYPNHTTTMDKSGEVEPKMKKKTLRLVGGATVAHLNNQEPKDYDLATEATPDEIRSILKFAGFTEVKPQTGKHMTLDKKYDKLEEGGDKSKIFYAKGWDRSGREFVIGARIKLSPGSKGREFEIATFRKDSKSGDGRTPDKMEFTPSLEEDSSRRDLTINAMYIPLTNPDGPNNKLLDPHGGIHHLKQGQVRFIGNPKDRLEEDQLRALRYVRFLARYGKEEKIPDEYKKAIEEVKDLKSVSEERIRDEFIKGLEHPDIDAVKYIKFYKQLGLLNRVFPDMIFKLDTNKDFSDKKEKRLAIAWILRFNEPEDVKEVLAKGTWQNNEINDIVHLIKLHRWFSKHGKADDEFFHGMKEERGKGGFYDMKSGMDRTSLVPSLVKQWGEMNKHNKDAVDTFADHKMDTKGYVKDEFGNRVVNPDIVSHLGKTPQGVEFGDAIRHIETEKFKNNLRKPNESFF